MRKIALTVSAAAFLALPVAAAPAADTPDVKVDGPKECVEGAVVAVGQMLQGITPEMQECRLT